MLQRGRHRRIREVRKESKGMVSEELGCLWADSDSLGFCSCWHLRGRGIVYIAIFLGMALDRLRDTAELQDMHVYHAKPFLVNAQPKVGGPSTGCPKVGDTKYNCPKPPYGPSRALVVSLLFFCLPVLSWRATQFSVNTKGGCGPLDSLGSTTQTQTFLTTVKKSYQGLCLLTKS